MFKKQLQLPILSAIAFTLRSGYNSLISHNRLCISRSGYNSLVSLQSPLHQEVATIPQSVYNCLCIKKWPQFSVQSSIIFATKVATSPRVSLQLSLHQKVVTIPCEYTIALESRNSVKKKIKKSEFPGQSTIALGINQKSRVITLNCIIQQRTVSIIKKKVIKAEVFIRISIVMSKVFRSAEFVKAPQLSGRLGKKI